MLSRVFHQNIATHLETRDRTLLVFIYYEAMSIFWGLKSSKFSMLSIFKFLSLLLDELFSWKYHLSEFYKRLVRTCGMLSKIKNLLPLDVSICLHNALFLFFLHYGLIVWGQTYASYADPIFKLQKKAVRAISFQPRMSPSLPIFNDLKLLKLSEIFKLRLLTIVFDSVNKTSSSCFHDFFLFCSSVHQYSTRQTCQGHLFMSKETAFSMV